MPTSFDQAPHINVRSQRVARFDQCDANHVTRLSISAAMRAKGYTIKYSDVEALDGTLVQQVRHKFHKIKAKNTTCPKSAAASLLLIRSRTQDDIYEA